MWGAYTFLPAPITLAGRGQQRRRPSSRRAEAHTGPLSSGSCPLAPEELAAWETGRAPSPMTQSVAGGAAPVPPLAPKSAEKQKELGVRGLWTWGINKALVQSQHLPTGWGPPGRGAQEDPGARFGKAREGTGGARREVLSAHCPAPAPYGQPRGSGSPDSAGSLTWWSGSPDRCWRGTRGVGQRLCPDAGRARVTRSASHHSMSVGSRAALARALSLRGSGGERQGSILEHASSF